LRNKGKCYNGE